MTVTFDDGLVKLTLPPEDVFGKQQLSAMFDSIAEYLDEIGVDCGGQFGLSIVIDYLDDRG